MNAGAKFVSRERSASTMDHKEALKHTLPLCGITQLKDKQEEAILAFLGGKDTFVYSNKAAHLHTASSRNGELKGV